MISCCFAWIFSFCKSVRQNFKCGKTSVQLFSSKKELKIHSHDLNQETPKNKELRKNSIKNATRADIFNRRPFNEVLFICKYQNTKKIYLKRNIFKIILYLQMIKKQTYVK